MSMTMEKKKITPEDFLLLRHLIHPDGDLIRGIAYENVYWEHNVFRREVVFLKGGREIRFSSSKMNYMWPRVSPDGKHVAFVAQTGKTSHAVLYDVDATLSRIITEYTDVTDIAWHPNNCELCLICGAKSSRVYLYQVASGDTKMLFQEQGTVCKPTFSPDGTKIAYVNTEEGNKIYCFHCKTGKSICLSDDVCQPVKLSQPFFAMDGDRVLCPGMSLTSEDELHHLFCLNADGTGAVSIDHRGDTPAELLPLYADGESLPNQNCYLCANADGEIIAVGARDGKTGIYHAAWANKDTLLWKCRYENRCCICGITADTAIISTEDTPFELYAMHGDAAPERLTEENRWINERNICRKECLHQENGIETGWGILRAGSERPVVLLVHGGPACYYTGGFSLEQQLLAAAGYNVVFANPHGSTGYGAAYADIHKAFDGTAEKDVMSLLQGVIGAGRVDGSRTAVMGGSYGGFLSAWLISTRQEFKAACVLRALLGGAPMKMLAGFDEQKMQHLAKGVTSPVLVMHGEEDTTCPYHYAREFFESLGTAQKRFVSFPAERHSVGELNAANAVKFYNEILNWWNEHL